MPSDHTQLHPDHNDAETTTRSDSLYHKAKREPRSRHIIRPRPASSTSSGRTQKSHGNPAHKALVANIRTFVLAAVAMAFILGISLQAARISWNIRERQLRKRAEANQSENLERRTKPDLPSATDSPSAPVDKKNDQAPPFDTDAVRRALYLSRQADSLSESDQNEKALDLYRQALKVWPYLTKAWARMGKLYLETGKYHQAQIALERAVENDPGSADILNDLGLTHLYQNRLDRALELFETAIDINADFAPAYFSIALVYLAKNDKEAAAGQLRQYLRFRPNDARALKEQAFLDASAGEYESALKSLKTALAESPEWTPLYFDAAATCALQGRSGEAIRYLQKAEAFSSPAEVYQALKQPAFKDIRLTEMGKLFEQELADRAREALEIQDKNSTL